VKRRRFITLLGCAAAAAPLPRPRAAHAQQPKRVGLLMNGVPTNLVSQAYKSAWEQQLRKLGWIDGQNLHIDYRWSEGNPALAKSYAAELVAQAPDVILSSSTANLIALQRLSPASPIVFVQVSDPVTQGFILSMARPGGNLTGFTAYEFTIGAKWLDLLKQLVPVIDRVGVMSNPQTAPQSKFFMDSIEAAAPTFGVKVVAAPVNSVSDIETAFANMSRQPNGGMVFPTDSFTGIHRKRIFDLAHRHRVPAIYANVTHVREGGLMGYAIDFTEQFRQAAIYVDRILKGTKAGDLPVQTPTKYGLAINLKAVRALDIEVPLSLLLIADEQIE
jgi:putative tryptophan/tyrosine transport system substrate-binding protein